MDLEKIKKDIEKSGLPLEMDVNDILTKRGWNVSNQSYYLDQTEKKGSIYRCSCCKVSGDKIFKAR